MATESFVAYARDDPQQDSEADETLSLCDLPLEGNGSSKEEGEIESNLATEQDLFQFFTGFNPDTNHASPRDIMFCGKVFTTTDSTQQKTWTDLRRSQSTTKAMRSTNSLNCAKPNCGEPNMARTTSLSQKSSTDRKSHSRWFKRSDTTVEGILASATPATVRPRWPLFLFGFAKAPAMELKDIRSRQSRMTPQPIMFSSIESGIVGRDGRKACWSLVRTLGGKGKVNGVMSASLGFLPRI